MVWVTCLSILSRTPTPRPTHMLHQINSRIGPRTKREKTRIAEQRTKEVYDRFNNNKITVQKLLCGLSFFATNG